MRLRPFSLEAIVLLPDRLHCVWTLPEGTVIFLAGGGAKAVVSRAVAHEVEALPTASRQAMGEPGVWQRRYREHLIRDETDFAAAHLLICTSLHRD